MEGDAMDEKKCRNRHYPTLRYTSAYFVMNKLIRQILSSVVIYIVLSSYHFSWYHHDDSLILQFKM